MSDRALPRILFLDPDHDFLDQMKAHGQKRQAQMEFRVFGRHELQNLEDIIWESLPDIIVINLDNESELHFGDCVHHIHHLPIAPAPIVVGISAQDERWLLQEAFKKGLSDYWVKPIDPVLMWLKLDVLLRLRQFQLQLDAATKQLSTLNLHLTKSNRKLEELTVTDDLTGLYNMRYMTQALDKQFTLLMRYQRPFSIIMLDLDHFKNVNDENDHLVGSETIRSIAMVIEASTRNTDIKARYGGDEYIIALPESDLKAAALVAERLRESIYHHSVAISEKLAVKVTASIGVASFEINRHKAFTDLIKDADKAMYRAKRSGRNRVCLFEDGEESGYDEAQSSILTAVKKVRGGKRG
jgi:two-component system cell cycle response regulator